MVKTAIPGGASCHPMVIPKQELVVFSLSTHTEALRSGTDHEGAATPARRRSKATGRRSKAPCSRIYPDTVSNGAGDYRAVYVNSSTFWSNQLGFTRLAVPARPVNRGCAPYGVCFRGLPELGFTASRSARPVNGRQVTRVTAHDA
jgi:hypothetical protein